MLYQNENCNKKIEYQYTAGDVNLIILRGGNVFDNPPLTAYEVRLLNMLNINGKVPRNIVKRVLGQPYLDIIEMALCKFS